MLIELRGQMQSDASSHNSGEDSFGKGVPTSLNNLFLD